MTPPTYLEDAFSQQGGEFVDESRRMSRVRASSPSVVGVDAGTHFSPPLLVQVRRTR